MSAETYTLLDQFDVWGNPWDGWDVNDQCTQEKNCVLSEDRTDEDILSFLQRIDYLDSRAILGENIEIEDMGDCIQVYAIVDLKDYQECTDEPIEESYCYALRKPICFFTLNA